MTPLLRALCAAGALLFALGAPAPALALAAPAVIQADLASGIAAFDAAVAAQPAALHTQTLRDLTDGARQFDLPGVRITALDGRPHLVDEDYAALRTLALPGAMSGWAIGLEPQAPVDRSGLRFHFAQPVTAFGLEIGDWGTCCFASSLYIAFEGGATVAVGTAHSAADNPGWALNGQFTHFVGAITFGAGATDVTLYGDGIGDYLVAGGTLRWALAATSGLPDLGSAGAGGGIAASVPELHPRALLLAGLIALPWLSRRRVRPLPVRRLR
ncbi:hypothetical protein AACH10_05985 [Ideonella sp. DXS22W]|uniref:LamG domain-containing protein n=1 Tax=Pseudaquabacterium inlustre TaxID=2984192 RepID=A0ABU9CD21_9BURK